MERLIERRNVFLAHKSDNFIKFFTDNDRFQNVDNKFGCISGAADIQVTQAQAHSSPIWRNGWSDPDIIYEVDSKAKFRPELTVNIWQEGDNISLYTMLGLCTSQTSLMTRVRTTKAR